MPFISLFSSRRKVLVYTSKLAACGTGYVYSEFSRYHYQGRRHSGVFLRSILFYPESHNRILVFFSYIEGDKIWLFSPLIISKAPPWLLGKYLSPWGTVKAFRSPSEKGRGMVHSILFPRGTTPPVSDPDHQYMDR